MARPCTGQAKTRGQDFAYCVLAMDWKPRPMRPETPLTMRSASISFTTTGALLAKTAAQMPSHTHSLRLYSEGTHRHRIARESAGCVARAVLDANSLSNVVERGALGVVP